MMAKNFDEESSVELISDGAAFIESYLEKVSIFEFEREIVNG